ncbi:hypothetical protein BU17DRAFT_89270 [Hysterangium stoloniferum]|nr:hypothetical protein BU17DRAFT_89270 [Hysterangium stoloniferum]
MTPTPKTAPSYLIPRKPIPRLSMSGPAEHTAESPQTDTSTRQDSATDQNRNDDFQDAESIAEPQRDHSPNTISNERDIPARSSRRSCIHENFPAAFDTGADGFRHARCQSCYEPKPNVDRDRASRATEVFRSKSTGGRHAENEVDPQRVDKASDKGDLLTRQLNGDAKSTAGARRNVSRHTSLAARQGHSTEDGGPKLHEQAERPYSAREIKTLKEEQRADEELLKAKKRELDCLQTIQRQAEKDEAAARSAHRAALRSERAQGLAFVTAKAKLESAVEDLLSKEAKLTTCRRKSSQHLVLAKEKEQEIEDLTQRKAIDDHERKTILREGKKKKRGWF